jgi:hypothetical protein
MTICCVLFISSNFFIIVLYAFHIFRISATHPAHLILLDFQSSEFKREYYKDRNLISKHCVGV